MCHGIHREFEHKVKSISMSTFDEAEVAALREGGNDKAKAFWRARYNPSDFIVPDPAEARGIREKRVRDFIKMTYIDKRWLKGEGKSAAASSSKGEEKKKKKKKVVESSSSEEEEVASSSDSSDEDAKKKKKKRRQPKPKRLQRSRILLLPLL